ncbi:MAG TPA: hypothetical protein VGY13_14700 [Solirubrobacteraceae bacterium]|jgi:predicted lipoprotein with Yx(FWY)xxD motif|nr:hypothetical protein [Solirubrobacteraceae bacterium]
MRPSPKSLLPALALSLTLAACGSSGSTTSTSSSASAASGSAAGTGSGTVNTASNSKLGATVLVDARGMTVYHLSGEGAGKFICVTGACEKEWPPVGASERVTSVEGLGTVKRPDGAEQLTYKGEPLYTFAGDKAPGEANGQGIKEGGTWSAVTTGSSAAAAPAPTTGSSSGSGEGSGSGESPSGGYGY